jgi:lipopolysaccharide transport system permease protein
MQRSKNLLTQVKIPPEALLLSIFLKISFNSFFRVVVMFVLSFVTNTLSWIGFIKFLLLYPSIVLVGMTFGVLLAPFNTIYNDVGKVIRISLRPLLYGTPVLYAVPSVTLLVYFNTFNPVGIILSNLRLLATQNIFQNMPAFMITLALLFIIFVSGWLIFNLSIPILSNKL